MKFYKVLKVTSVKLKGLGMQRKFLQMCRLTRVQGQCLKRGMCDIKECLYLVYGRKLFEKVPNIPNMIHMVWEDSESINLCAKT